MMRAVPSSAPLTKRRPSGSSARHMTALFALVREGAQDGAVVDVEELDGAIARGGEHVRVVGQRREVHRRRRPLVMQEGAHERAIETVHPDWCHQPCAGVAIARPAEDAMAVGHHRHRPHGLIVPGAGAHKALAGDVPHLDELILRAADDVLTVGRHRHRVHRAGVPLEGVDERPVDVVQPDLTVGKDLKADHKVHAVGQRRDAVKVTVLRFFRDGALVSAVEIHRAKVRPLLQVTTSTPSSIARRSTPRSNWMERTHACHSIH